MENLNPIFTPYHFDVEVVTPVHIGMAQEKNYVRGLDYVLEGNEAWIINTDKLFKELKPAELQHLTLQLASGQAQKLEPLLRPILEKEPDKLILGKLKTAGQPNDIRRFYRTGMGHYVLPGTSLKGAIRSIFLAELKTIAEQKNLPGSSRQKDQLETLMGRIDNNLMRFIQVGDVDFTKTPAVEVRRTKVFSADNKAKGIGEEGKWKHGNTTFNGDSKHSPIFADSYYGQDGFVTFYETLIPDEQQLPPVLTIRLGSQLPHEIGRYATGSYLDNGAKKENVINYASLLAERSGEWLVKTIREHTHQYLTREKAYFTRFANTDLDKLKPIQDRLDELIRQNKRTDSCLLRVGAGVGFHSITGDWQDRSQKDHTQSWIDPQGNEFINSVRRESYKKLKNQIFAKTRKFAFKQTKEGIDFLLMGFIKLTLQTPESATTREQKLILARQQANAKQVADAEAKAKRQEEERVKAEEAKTAKENERRKPFEGKLRKGIPLYAEVMTVSGAKTTLKLLALGHENDRLALTYNGLAVGQLIQVEVKDISGKGKVMAIGFKSL